MVMPYGGWIPAVLLLLAAQVSVLLQASPAPYLLLATLLLLTTLLWQASGYARLGLLQLQLQGTAKVTAAEMEAGSRSLTRQRLHELAKSKLLKSYRSGEMPLGEPKPEVLAVLKRMEDELFGQP